MKTTIYLIRHGESIGNARMRYGGTTDYKLTAKGYNQVDQLTKRMENVHIDIVYASNLQRAINTVTPLAKNKGLQVNIDPDLRELHYGVLEDVDDQYVQENFSELLQEWKRTGLYDRNIPEQESIEYCTKRMTTTIQKIVDSNKGKTICIGCHAMAMMCFFVDTFKLRERDIILENTCINIIEYDHQTNKYELLSRNDCAHLDNMQNIEYADIIDQNGNDVGGVLPLWQIKERHMFRRAAQVWIYNSKGQLLLARRSKNKRYEPLKWDASAGGHVDAGEDYMDAAIRETNEELGIELNWRELNLVSIRRAPGLEYFFGVYVVFKDVDLNTIRYATDEVDEIKYVDLQEFERMYYDENVTDLVKHDNIKDLLDYIKARDK